MMNHHLSWEPHNLFMTGCCGFIGSNVINYLCHKYESMNFYNLDRLDYCADQKNVEVSRYSNYKFFKGDIKNRDLITMILNDYQIDTVIHFAAQTHVDNSFINSLQFTVDNVYGTHILIDSIHNYGKVHRFIHISTDEVYGEVNLEDEGCTEKSLLNPTNPYSATKACAEFLVRSYYYSFQLPVIIVRSNNVFGPRQYPEKIIPNFIDKLKNKNKCPIHGKGETRRNFIYVQDFACAIETILFQGTIMEIYNIGAPKQGYEFSVLEIAQKLIQKIIGKEAKWEEWVDYIDDRKFNDFRYCINSDSLRELGWKEQWTFDQGLDQTIAWYLKNEADIKPPQFFLENPTCF